MIVLFLEFIPVVVLARQSDVQEVGSLPIFVKCIAVALWKHTEVKYIAYCSSVDSN